MKKHVFLTSLFAIGIACSAHAAKTDSNVTFGGTFTQDDVEYTVGDKAAATTYGYDLPNGARVDNVVYTESPDLSGFAFDFMGDTKKDYDPENTLNPEDFTLSDTIAASGSVHVAYTGDKLIAGGSVSESDYTITVNDKEYKYADGRPEAKGEVILNPDYTNQTIVVENGAAVNGIDIEQYSWTDPKTNLTYGLLEQEGEIVPTLGDAIVSANGGLQAFIDAYNADVAAVAAMEQATSEEGMADIYAAFDEADGIYASDKGILDTLNNLYAGYQASDNAYKAALDAQQAATEQYAVNNQSFQDAQDLYNSSIMGTINDAIDTSLESVNTALAEKASVEDVEANKTAIEENATNIATNQADIKTNTDNIAANKTAIDNETSRATAAESELDTKIATNTTAITANKTAIESEVARATAAEEALSGRIDTNASAIAENKSAIETNATNIAANTQAIADEADARKAADDKLAKDIKAGDEMALAKAKAYADEQSSLALKSAKNYTDKKVNAMEKELSAGIASATAMSSIEVSNVAKGEVSVGGGYGYYNSQSAVAFGAAMGLTDNWSVNAAAGLADSNVSFRAGTNYKFKLF